MNALDLDLFRNYLLLHDVGLNLIGLVSGGLLLLHGFEIVRAPDFQIASGFERSISWIDPGRSRPAIISSTSIDAPCCGSKAVATLRIDAPLFDDVEELRWRGATKSFRSTAEKIGNARLATRVTKLKKVGSGQ